jgi:ribonuclease D
VTAVAEAHDVPVENLLTPEFLRRLCWTPPADPTPEVIAETLRGMGARGWQINLTAAQLAAALRSRGSAAG